MMQRRALFGAIFGGLGAALMGRHSQARDRTILIQDSPIAGFQFYRGNSVLPLLRVGEELSLVRDPRNEHDSDAVAVYFRNDKLGFVPRVENRAIAQMLDRGERLKTRISELLAETDPYQPLRISIFLV
jgi:hypothetical protein